MNKSDFYYPLPKALIAQEPLPERTGSRLMNVGADQGAINHLQFLDLIRLVNEKDILVFNDTRVIPARIWGHKQSGGKVELLIERIISETSALTHIRASKTPKQNTVIELEKGYSCRVIARHGDLFEVIFESVQSVFSVLNDIGHIPLPPYIQRPDKAQDRARYQTVFAKHEGAVAAPTAGLHFDQALLQALKEKGVNFAYVTLHVGSGTFQPVRVEQLNQHIMHEEHFEVTADTIQAIDNVRANGGRVIAVGTTAVRALESASVTGMLLPNAGFTDLFITPGYKFKSVDAMITNFHLSESTLLMLVSAFSGYELIKAAYQRAITEKYRFFSYGDAMFLHNNS
ncbi:MAG: tRNA preQ1(34) S-adenosylmethionine ribosyltransferase-isomerase QueA [Methylococcales bacterium]|nr:tRNA preQ1(34) S-adenosylmethionine ribosyltransferase-isomerase QueA [Methylococcaceae bacterium]HIL39979.1 tRNA preQ1(34) S-adenosylmethionine ribosyltransferase-isomerase QueA [Methylococcales bacterium]